MGKPVVHWELWSKEPESVGRFYAEVFEWKITAVPELDYTFVDTEAGEGINGGIMRPQEGEWPGNMAMYIDVDDLETYQKKIEAAGGKTLVAKMEIPNFGALGLFQDTDGRTFGLWKRDR